MGQARGHEEPPGMRLLAGARSRDADLDARPRHAADCTRRSLEMSAVRLASGGGALSASTGRKYDGDQMIDDNDPDDPAPGSPVALRRAAPARRCSTTVAGVALTNGTNARSISRRTTVHCTVCRRLSSRRSSGPGARPLAVLLRDQPPLHLLGIGDAQVSRRCSRRVTVLFSPACNSGGIEDL
jgi:hypothetical protein